MIKAAQNIHNFAAAMLLLLPLYSCGGQDEPENGDGQSAPEGMVEICPVLPGMFSEIPRDPATIGRSASRTYDDNETTNTALKNNKTIRLPEGSTVWLIAQSGNTYVKKSYVVYNPEDEETSYLVPCKVNNKGEVIINDKGDVINDKGEVINEKGEVIEVIKDYNEAVIQGTPLYLKNKTTYKFYAISPARELIIDETTGQIGFKIKNGESLYANDSRYARTTPTEIEVEFTPGTEVQKVELQPMINQTAQLKFQIGKGKGVHDLDIQPSGIEVAGLQNDEDGIDWHMSLNRNEPIELKHGEKNGIYTDYDYKIDDQENVTIEVPIVPIYSISKPVIVTFRLKVNGVPSTFEMMLNEKDFKAGYSYGYRGTVSTDDCVEVISWQFISWEEDAVLIPNSETP